MITITLFGATKVSVDDVYKTTSELGGLKPLQILTMLAVELGHPVTKERLAEQLWEEEGGIPPRYRSFLEAYVCLLRRGLGIRRERGAALATTHQGYLLDPDQVRVDLADAQRLLTRAARGRRARGRRCSDGIGTGYRDPVLPRGAGSGVGLGRGF